MFNVLGQEVTQLIDDMHAPGAYELTWDGINNEGSATAAGVYILRIVAGSQIETRTLTFIK